MLDADVKKEELSRRKGVVMVGKDELLQDLNGYLMFEEELTNKLSNFYKTLGWKHEVEEKYHKEIMEGLDILNEDTKRHSLILKDMLKYVKEAEKGEF